MAEQVPITGFIGLGQQGGPMAERMLAAGFPLLVWARRPEALAAFVEQGARACASVAELAAQADHIGICVVDDTGVLALCEELIPAMRPGALLSIHSTILLATCEDLALRCASHFIGFIDAPVSGGGGAAAAGTLTVMCGGTTEDFAQAAPVLRSFAGKLVHLGTAGAGQRAKIVNNALMAANMGLAHATLGMAETLDIDRTALADLIKHSSGRSFGFEVFARLPEPAAFAHGAPLLVNDVNLLNAIAPDSINAQVLRAAAEPFLTAATSQPLTKDRTP